MILLTFVALAALLSGAYCSLILFFWKGPVKAGALVLAGAILMLGLIEGDLIGGHLLQTWLRSCV